MGFSDPPVAISNLPQLIHIDMNQDQSVYKAHAAMQESIVNWGRLLIATGGSLKTIK